MEHRKLKALMTPVERIARVAAAGLTSATSSVTQPSGARSYDNADGTRTIIGEVANGESNPSYTMATHVGDTTAPSTPTGITASSKSGVVVVEWDGTLTGGIPDDFYCVRVYLDGSELGILTGAGSVSSASLEGGTTHSVTATAEDDCCLPDGTPAHNVSAPCEAVTVTVTADAESVAAIAQDALDVANATGQHFFADDGGIHVTEVTQDEWNESHSGANVLINALGQLFRDGLNNLLSLTTQDGARALTIWDGLGNAAENIRAIIGKAIQLGKADESHATLDYHSMQLIDKEGNTYFYVSDLRDESGYATLVESGTLTNADQFSVVMQRFSVSMPIASVDYVEVDGVTLDPSEYDVEPSSIAFHEDQPEGSLVEVSYKTDSSDVKAYTLGIRRSGSHVGALSHAEGYDVEASGALSHAEGHGTEASGYVSHTEGNLSSARGYVSHAEGESNVASGSWSHAEGTRTFATGSSSHSEGTNTSARGNYSHAQNAGTTATCMSQTVIGEFNELDASTPSARGKYALIIGNGTDENHRSNAHTVDWDGNAWYAGDVSDGGGHKLADVAATADGLKTASGVTKSSWLTALGIHGPASFGMWMGSKVVNTGSTAVTAFTLFTKAELQAIVGTGWTPTGTNCSVFVMNGDTVAFDGLMMASINSSSVVKVHASKAKAGLVRVNYLIIRFA